MSNKLCRYYGKDSDCHKLPGAPKWCVKSDEATCKYFNSNVNKSIKNVIKTPVFDYSQVDEETAGFLQEKAVNIAQINAVSIAAIGKELKEAHERLANYRNGYFQAWVESLGISYQTAYNYMNVYNLFIKRFDNKTEFLKKAPAKLLYAIAKPSANPQLVEAVANGEITTFREYKELEEKLKQTEQKKLEVERKLKDLSVIKERLEEQNKILLKDKNKAEKALEDSDDAYKKEIEELQARVKELILDLEDKREQLKQRPIEVTATKEVVPSEIQEELHKLREIDQGKRDYEKISNILGEISSITNEEIKHWAKVAQGIPDNLKLIDMMDEAIHTINRMEDAYKRLYCETKLDTPQGMCAECTFADMDQVNDEQLDNDQTWCTKKNMIVNFFDTCQECRPIERE